MYVVSVKNIVEQATSFLLVLLYQHIHSDARSVFH